RGGVTYAVTTGRRRARHPGLEAPPRPRPPEAPPPAVEEAPPSEQMAPATVEIEELPYAVEPEVVEKPRFRDRLGKARSLFAGYVGSVLSRSTIDDETWDDLEEALIRADVGIAATTALLDDLRARVKAEGITTPLELVDALKDDLKKTLAPADRGLRYEPGSPNVWLFVGVNGGRKTTTIGQLAHQQASAGRTA